MPDLFFDNDFRALIPPLAIEERQELEQSLLRDGNRCSTDVKRWLNEC